MNSIKEFGSINSETLLDEEVRIRNLLSTSSEPSNTQDANLFINQVKEEQNVNPSLSSSSNSKKRKFCSTSDEIENDKPLKKLFSVSNDVSASSNQSSASSTPTTASPSTKVPEHTTASPPTKVPEHTSSISSLLDYNNCKDHSKYDEKCKKCQQIELFSRELAKDGIILEEIIGEGAFGTVFKGSFKNEWVAIKIFFNERAIDDYENEIKYLKKLESHQNLIEYKFSKKYGRTGVIIFELMEGSLINFITENNGYFRDANNSDKLVKVVKGMARGIQALHRKNIVHVDFHPGNVLLDRDFNVKITDFGLSKMENEEDEMVGGCARSYRPPEAKGSINSRADHRMHSDIFQFGVMLVNLILTQNRNEIFNGIPGSYIVLVNNCLRTNPHQRPSIEQIISLINNW